MTKKAFALLLMLVLLSALFLGSYLTAFGQEGADSPDLKGTWVTVDSIGKRVDKFADAEETDPFMFEGEGSGRNVVMLTMVIDFQDGAIFSGTRGTEKKTEAILGAISSDNESLYIVDEDGLLFGKLLADDKMEIVYLETGDYAQVVARDILTRQK